MGRRHRLCADGSVWARVFDPSSRAKLNPRTCGAGTPAREKSRQDMASKPAKKTRLRVRFWKRTASSIEAVCVWIAVASGTVIVFETFKLWQASGRAAKHAFLGRK